MDQIVFSTTDDRGVITDANTVFGYLAHYPRTELIGAPHNIIRHPAMPGAVFKAMWDTLQAGEPFVGYVRNLSEDGKEYVVFATVTPLPGGGYLSVRTRPVVKELFSAAIGIYRAVRRAEEGFADDGMNRREVAAAGVDVLLEQLAAAGFDSYAPFMWQALPAEVTTREAHVEGLPRRGHEPGVLGHALGLTRDIMSELNTWMDAAEELLELADKIRSLAANISRDLTEGAVSEQMLQAFAAHGPQTAMLAEPLRLWIQMQPIVSSALTTMVATLNALAENSARTRFQIALSRLHTTMIANFLVELLDGEQDAAASARSIEQLTIALRDGMHQMRASVAENRTLSAASAESVSKTTYALDVPHQVLQMFTASIAGVDLPAELAEHVRTVTAAAKRAEDNLARVNKLIEECRQASQREIPFTIDATLDALVADAPRIADPSQWG